MTVRAIYFSQKQWSMITSETLEWPTNQHRSAHFSLLRLISVRTIGRTEDANLASTCLSWLRKFVTQARFKIVLTTNSCHVIHAVNMKHVSSLVCKKRSAFYCVRLTL